MLLAVLAVRALAGDGDTAVCVACHDFGADSPVHAVQAGSHGSSDDPAGVAGCSACHGASTRHTRAPLQVSPSVSFGPRWSASGSDQDEQCLACHEANQASHWKDALHMLNNLTCVTCHDIHTMQDKVLFSEEQAKVCTICHKNQKKGIHGLQIPADASPPCSSCHNPHDHESAQAELLRNGSEGCRSCHDLEGIDRDPLVSQGVKRRHRLMLQPDHTCLDCHRGIAHTPTDATTAMTPEAVTHRVVTLFYPGMANSDWLLQGHPGSQPLRQGRNCQQCHRGEEAGMGEAQAGRVVPAAREVAVSFSSNTDQLTVTLTWQGPEDDVDIALMWDDGGSEAFRRGGCFAACHSDLPGMSADRGQHTGKYLWASRSQLQRVGRPSLVRNANELAALKAAGDFVELWRVELASGRIEVATVLADVTWQPGNLIQINKSYGQGQWTVAMTAPMNNTGLSKPFTLGGKYTFGVALHGAGNPGGKHWVSLPMTLSFDGDETDFKVEQQ
ncbi:MAG: NapC/NirT family cytochrome c [Pseudomonadales bacterium]|nr:NapC/NirT family cytochrome c [Halioglobus sp.]MCP5122778.1 NapC/NirT family cytochrome c [Pseudomonadales bacterium]MCP5193991.1 NapC/NirT family cytochrome c [Pseudomonadales bacterium]